MLAERVNEIEMVVLNDDEFLSPYCGHDPVISGEVAGYMENAAKAGGPASRFRLKIFSDVITPEEAVIYDRAIRNYYRNEREHLTRERHRNAVVALAMLIAGVLIFALRLLFPVMTTWEILDEVIDIAGWVFVWEAVDQYAFQRHKINLEYGMACHMAEAEITFAPLDREGLGAREDLPAAGSIGSGGTVR